MKEQLDRAGRWVASLYIGLLALTVWAFPVFFVLGLTLLAAFILDAVGLGRTGIAGLALFAIVWFLALVFFSPFAWPHISPTIDKIIGVINPRP